MTYWMLYPYVPVVIENQLQITNKNKTVRPGEKLKYQVWVNKKLPISAEIHMSLVNHYIVTYSPTYSNIPVGRRLVNVFVLIPPYAPPGEYSLRWEGEYQVNPVRTIKVCASSEKFTIAGRPIPKPLTRYEKNDLRRGATLEDQIEDIKKQLKRNEKLHGDPHD